MGAWFCFCRENDVNSIDTRIEQECVLCFTRWGYHSKSQFEPFVSGVKKRRNTRIQNYTLRISAQRVERMEEEGEGGWGKHSFEQLSRRCGFSSRFSTVSPNILFTFAEMPLWIAVQNIYSRQFFNQSDHCEHAYKDKILQDIQFDDISPPLPYENGLGK